ncbi:MAG: nonstructural protein [Microviridae sp.]|nr:MAG: nonstructural protein [Microviridae sp.]
MIAKYYSLFDRVHGRFMMPFPHHNDGMAMRSVSDSLQEKDSPVSKHTPDYALYYVSAFDDETGVFLEEKPRLVINCIDLAPAPAESPLLKVVS